MMSSNEINSAQRLVGLDQNIWEDFAALLAEHEPVDVGKGFPNFSPAEHVKEAFKLTVTGPDIVHQYTRMYGHPKLVQSLSRLYGPLHGRDIEWNKEIVVTLGAYTAIFCAIQAFVEAGDEVIIIEPFFSCYPRMVKYAGGQPKFIPLRPQKVSNVNSVSSNSWILDPLELESLFNSNTKAFILNNPSNPLGKVFTQEELQSIADLCIKHNCLCISDEVYEWITYDCVHTRIANLPGMWERTITVGSAGKTLSVTGWRTGWCIGPNSLLKHLQTVVRNSTAFCPTAVQEALAVCIDSEIPLLGKSGSYFQILSDKLKKKRNVIAQSLREVGLNPIIPDGGYFMLVDVSNLDVDLSNVGEPGDTWDFKLVKWLIINKKVAAMPTFDFFNQEHRISQLQYVRFCFAKEDHTLDEMAAAFKKYGGFACTV